ncbi:MAG: MFS transporter [Vicinamibacterales bacterium]
MNGEPPDPHSATPALSHSPTPAFPRSATPALPDSATSRFPHSGTSLSSRQSRLNVLVSAAACGIGFTGFTLVMPFLPLYISELGVTDVGEVALWTGLTLGATPAVTAVSAPLWGRVGDRYGSKLLVVRSLSAFVLTKAAMGFVTSPWQLFALRALLGVFAGYGALTMSMAAESVPRERMAAAIGTVQVGQRLGPAIGPILGGILAPIVGLRAAFLVTAAFYLVALILVLVVYREPRERRERVAPRTLGSVVSQLAGTPGFLLLLGVIFAMQMVDRSFGPILPLYVAQLGVSSSAIALVSGALFSTAAVFAAVGHRYADNLLKRWSPRTLIATSSVAAAIAVGLAGLIPALWIFAIALAVSGAAIGVAMTAAYASAGALLPSDAHSTGFGLMTTASLVGMAGSPIMAGLVGSSAIRVVFAVDVALLAALTWSVWRYMQASAASPRPTVASDVSVS